MRRDSTPDKPKVQWEQEMLDCLEEARKAVGKASKEERPSALHHYRTVLSQFNALLLEGKIPSEDPCYTTAERSGATA